ncbi:non-ribosomal peptide synthetase, partial [Granulicella sp. S190]|uniref:non-ribosomal peptide synthetase n=1 Tax=Granulicella sp. S190 TaxID=1747226 RepID=UPI001C203AEC
DLGRWHPDGTIEFLGRNDDQVKIRGFRIELGEIETQLLEHPEIREAVVMAREDKTGGKRLVAYYVGANEVSAEDLRSHLQQRLPEYMIPAAYVRMEKMPLTPNGKLDRKALPEPESDAYGTSGYEAPVGKLEILLAQAFAEVLDLEQVGRKDNFFELGGHSLLIVRLLSLLRGRGVELDIRNLFQTPTVMDLAATTADALPQVEVPPNLIPTGSAEITPEMLPLVLLSEEQIAGIVACVPGGARNVQDIYPLAPLQEGIFFHYLMTEQGDPYLSSGLMAFDSRKRLNGYLRAMQAVVDRHDILRTAIFWEGIPEPVQVVLRRVELPVEEVALSGEGDAVEELYRRFDPRHRRIDLRQAPLLRLYVAHDAVQNRWLLLMLIHHIVQDNTSTKLLLEEVRMHLLGRGEELPAPIPFRNYVAHARLGMSREEHEMFFRQMLGDVEEPTAPFGLLEVQGDGSEIVEAHLELPASLSRRMRESARRLGVSTASLCHLAWATVLARVSGREDVVFGTVFFGRMQGGAGAAGALGLYINTLPLRISFGTDGVLEGLRQTHLLLSELLRHEHASLALAQRCSGVPAPAPLFSSLLNYRHSREGGPASSQKALQGMTWLRAEERTNYPFELSIDDLGDGFWLTAQTASSIDPGRVCAFMETALNSLVTALESALDTPLRKLEVLPASERQQLLYGWNATALEYGTESACVHELFEAQAERSPDAVAVVFEDRELTYGELNRAANRLAHSLRELGVKPDDRVALCVERGFAMIVGLLAILKSGGAYVPLDPVYPVERLQFMLRDSEPVVLLIGDHLAHLFPTGGSAKIVVLQRNGESVAWSAYPEWNLARAELNPSHLAYVIYTSGSTGTPKGVMVEHRNIVNRLVWMQSAYGLNQRDVVLQKTPFGFDVSVWEFFWPLLYGAQLVMARPEGHKDPVYLMEIIRRNKITTIHFVPSMLEAFLSHAGLMEDCSLTRVICSGEALSKTQCKRFEEQLPQATLYNLYGPTETSVDVTSWTCTPNAKGDIVPIGRPIANTQIYILDGVGEPVPIGVSGELYIG